MLLTEDEAKTKWCPHAVASHTDPRRGFHAGETRDEYCFTCIASECMAWRWAGWRTKSLGFIAERPADDDKDGGRLGYCSLAGAAK